MAILTSLNIDGDLIQDKGTGTASGTATGVVGSTAIFESAASNTSRNWPMMAITYDSSNNKIVIAYEDAGNSNYGTAVVGTVSGTSISFGTPVPFDTAVRNVSIAFEATANKVVIAYIDDSNSQKGTAIVGTVSGTSISFGTKVVFDTTSYCQDPQIIFFGTLHNKVVISYRGSGGSGYAIVGAVSGTSISFGTTVVYGSGSGGYGSIAYDGNTGKAVIAYRDAANSYYGTAIVGTVSGTSISFGTAVVFLSTTQSSGGKPSPEIAFAASGVNKTVIIWGGDAYEAFPGYAIVGTIANPNSTTITFGSVVQFASQNISDYSIVFDSGVLKFQVVYRDGYPSSTANRAVAIPGTISGGTSISFGTAVVGPSGNAQLIGTTYDSTNDKIVTAYKDVSNSNYGTSLVFQTIGAAGEIEVDLATGNFFEVDLQNASGPIETFTITEALAGTQVQTFVLKITQGSTARQFNWSGLTNVKWPGSTPPVAMSTTNNAVDIYSFTTYDAGTTWYGEIVGQNFT